MTARMPSAGDKCPHECPKCESNNTIFTEYAYAGDITELGFEASVKRRTETVNTAIASQCATNSAAKTVTFGDPFFPGTGSLGGSTTAFAPSIGITLDGAVSGDYFKITSVTGTQFVIETRDSSNAFKDLSFKYTAIGFGKGS